MGLFVVDAYMCIQCLWKTQLSDPLELVSGVAVNHCKHWELNLCPSPEEQHMLLTAELSLQPEVNGVKGTIPSLRSVLSPSVAETLATLAPTF